VSSDPDLALETVSGEEDKEGGSMKDEFKQTDWKHHFVGMRRGGVGKCEYDYSIMAVKLCFYTFRGKGVEGKEGLSHILIKRLLHFK
jgi:hypothetical protein